MRHTKGCFESTIPFFLRKAPNCLKKIPGMIGQGQATKPLTWGRLYIYRGCGSQAYWTYRKYERFLGCIRPLPWRRILMVHAGDAVGNLTEIGRKHRGSTQNQWDP